MAFAIFIIYSKNLRLFPCQTYEILLLYVGCCRLSRKYVNVVYQHLCFVEVCAWHKLMISFPLLKCVFFYFLDNLLLMGMKWVAYGRTKCLNYISLFLNLLDTSSISVECKPTACREYGLHKIWNDVDILLWPWCDLHLDVWPWHY